MAYPTDAATKHFSSYVCKKTSVDSHEYATACYELQMPKIHNHYSSLLADISLKNQVPPTALQQLQ